MHPVRAFAVLTLTVVLPSATVVGADERSTTGLSVTELRQRMTPVLEALDSAEYASEVSWAEHVVLAYRAGAGRDPSALELFTLLALRDDVGLRRSDALSIALRGSEPSATAEQVREFLERSGPGAFRSTAATRQLAARLEATPSAELVRQIEARYRRPRTSLVLRPETPPAPEAGVDYNVYYGYLHAHSELSDGEGDARYAYEHARDVGGLDFFGLTDHGELLVIWPWENKWSELKGAAEATNAPGTYATIWGFEWSSPIVGHINVINSTDMTHSLDEVGLDDIYDWIRTRPRVIGRFNHPGRYDDLLTEFDHLDLYAPAVLRMVGIETFDKDGGFGEFHYDCDWLFCDGTYLDEGLDKGWFLGALGGQDNHSTDWGDRNEFRTAVLAENLTRRDILIAYYQRRFYATEDSDLELDVRVDGFPIGSRLSGVPRIFEVSACDGSGDLFDEIRLYRNGSLIATETVLGDCVGATFDDTGRSGGDAYYVIVRQTDDGDGDGRGDEAIASPIWID